MMTKKTEKPIMERNMEVKHHIDLKESVNFVSTVASECFLEEVYLPSLVEFSFQYHVLERFTNLPLPNSISKCYDMLLTTGIYEQATKEISPSQLLLLKKAVLEAIDFKKQLLLKK